MKKNKAVPKVKSPDKSETDKVSNTDGTDDLTDAEKIVGVHILGQKDTRRHFGTPRIAERENDKGNVKEK